MLIKYLILNQFNKTKKIKIINKIHHNKILINNYWINVKLIKVKKKFNNLIKKNNKIKTNNLKNKFQINFKKILNVNNNKIINN